MLLVTEMHETPTTYADITLCIRHVELAMLSDTF